MITRYCLCRLMKRFGLSAFDCFYSYSIFKIYVLHFNTIFHLQGKTKDYDMLIQKLADPDIKVHVYFAQYNFDYLNSSWDICRVRVINNLDS